MSSSWPTIPSWNKFGLFRKPSLSCWTLPCHPVCAAPQPGDVFLLTSLSSLCVWNLQQLSFGWSPCLYFGRPPSLPCDKCFADRAVPALPKTNVTPHQMLSGSRGYLHRPLPSSRLLVQISLARGLKAQKICTSGCDPVHRNNVSREPG